MRLGPAAVEPFVEHREQVVEDGAVGVEKLVEESKLRLGKHARGDRRDNALAEPGDVDGPNNSFGSEKRVSRYSK